VFAPPPFGVTDAAALTAFLRAHPLATLVVNGADGPVTAHAPLVVVAGEDGAPVELIGHVSRANPFWRVAQGLTAVAVFTGPDAYVSPSFYPSKLEHGQVVPTWNYQRAEVRGVLALETDPEQMAPYLAAPTDAMEQGRAQPWSLADAPDGFVARMSRGVVGLRLRVTAAEGVFKLSQNKDAADHAGVVFGLKSSLLPNDRVVAEAMTRARTSA
jgi:transcriptional regulator